MIYFLVNGDASIGSGHFGRCLSIAKGLSGYAKTFISWSLADKFRKELVNCGIEFWDIAHDDLACFPDQFKITKSSMLIVDSDDEFIYRATFQNRIRASGLKLMVITVSDKFHLYADLVLNQSIISVEQKFSTERHTKLLLGPNYFIFDRRFRSLKRSPVRINTIKTVFIGFGAADPLYHTKKILESLDAIALFSEIKFMVVLGPLNTKERFEDVNNLVSESNLNVEVLYDVKDLYKVYDRCDLAICSPGRMFWELALLGIRSIIIPSSNREVETSMYLNENQFAFMLSPLNEKTHKKELIEILQNDRSVAMNLEKLQKKINPNGLSYICEEIKEQLKN